MKHSQLPKLLAFLGIMIFTLVMAVFFWSTGPANSIDLDEGEMPSARANSADPSVEEDSDPEVTSVREEQQETQNPNQSKAQRQPASSVRESVTANSVAAFFETQGGGQWQVRTTDDGEVFRVIGGEVKEIGKSGESIRSFMMSLAPELGISAEQVDGLPEADSTRNLLIYDSFQVYQGIPVYQGWFRILVNRKTKAGFVFNNSLKKVEEGFALTPNINLNQAESVVKDSFGSSIVSYYDKSGPVVWASSTPHQLAYVFHVKLKDDTKKLVVGANSGTIIHQESTVMH